MEMHEEEKHTVWLGNNSIRNEYLQKIVNELRGNPQYKTTIWLSREPTNDEINFLKTAANNQNVDFDNRISFKHIDKDLTDAINAMDNNNHINGNAVEIDQKTITQDKVGVGYLCKILADAELKAGNYAFASNIYKEIIGYVGGNSKKAVLVCDMGVVFNGKDANSSIPDLPNIQQILEQSPYHNIFMNNGQTPAFITQPGYMNILNPQQTKNQTLFEKLNIIEHYCRNINYEKIYQKIEQTELTGIRTLNGVLGYEYSTQKDPDLIPPQTYGEARLLIESHIQKRDEFMYHPAHMLHQIANKKFANLEYTAKTCANIIVLSPNETFKNFFSSHYQQPNTLYIIKPKDQDVLLYQQYNDRCKLESEDSISLNDLHGISFETLMTAPITLISDEKFKKAIQIEVMKNLMAPNLNTRIERLIAFPQACGDASYSTNTDQQQIKNVGININSNHPQRNLSWNYDKKQIDKVITDKNKKPLATKSKTTDDLASQKENLTKTFKKSIKGAKRSVDNEGLESMPKFKKNTK